MCFYKINAKVDNTLMDKSQVSSLFGDTEKIIAKVPNFVLDCQIVDLLLQLLDYLSYEFHIHRPKSRVYSRTFSWWRCAQCCQASSIIGMASLRVILPRNRPRPFVTTFVHHKVDVFGLEGADDGLVHWLSQFGWIKEVVLEGRNSICR